MSALSQQLKSVPKLGLVAIARVYQWTISPWVGPCCRFHPSCSQYAIDSVKCFGVLRGSLLTLWRLLRCQPLCKGGFDPVPKKK